MRPFEFLIPRRPLSVQAKTQKLDNWRKFVREAAQNQWTGEFEPSAARICATLLYFFEGKPPDIDNIVKPILDALKGLVFDDDASISDIVARRRPLGGAYDLKGVSPLLSDAIGKGEEFVYVHVCDAPAEEELI